MKLPLKGLHTILVLFLLSVSVSGIGQTIPALSLNLKKPQKLADKQLPSEKTGDKKFTLPRKLYQNTVTHYNWQFNANEKIKTIIANAKDEFKDDYSQLLPFYNLDLERTAADSVELDSVIYKANAGILLHDLRNAWIDDLYMLMGKAYYYRKTFDTAYLTFQYMNYAFAPKEKDGYDKWIGSNASEGGNVFSVVSPEKKNLPILSTFAHTSQRNDAFIWQIRTFLTMGAISDAAALIEILKTDPQFPERLRPSLAEMQALYFYTNARYDSAAHYLSKALPNAENREEQARWEFLIGQLYERSNQHTLAASYYERTVQHTLNPILEIYARLNSIRQRKGDAMIVQENIQALEKMIKKERFDRYHNIIYYSIAQMELERPDTSAALLALKRSTQSNTAESADQNQRGKSFLLLGDLHFGLKQYEFASMNYDSINNTSVIVNPTIFEYRQNILRNINNATAIIQRQDSLQKIAAMPENERAKFIKDKIKAIRKQQGLKEDPLVGNINALSAPTTLSIDDKKGEWYFYSASLRTKGQAEFKNIWGNRPNTDNWRRQAASMMASNTSVNASKKSDLTNAAQDIIQGALNEEALKANLPLTADQLKKSNDSIQNALFLKALTLKDGLEDYPAAITSFEHLLERFPENTHRAEILFNLYYCYVKINRLKTAEQIGQAMRSDFPKDSLTAKINLFEGKKTEQVTTLQIDHAYTAIYNAFISGQYNEALLRKKEAEKNFGKTYWTPQLSYIEAVYNIHENQDSVAIVKLQEIIGNNPGTAMADKAQTLINVLGQRNEREAYLKSLQLAIVEEPIMDVPLLTKNTPKTAPPQSNKRSDIQTLNTLPQGNMARNVLQKDTLKQVTQAVLPDTIKNVKTIQVIGGTKKDTIAKQTVLPVFTKQALPVATILQPVFKKDSIAPHAVIIITDQVDGVFVGEAKNAFNRYNKQKQQNLTVEVTAEKITETKRIVVITSFPNEANATNYYETIRKVATTEIIPWLSPSKFKIAIISLSNLDILRKEKDFEALQRFMEITYPGKF